jgi:hypothetical protein
MEVSINGGINAGINASINARKCDCSILSIHTQNDNTNTYIIHYQ